jgi:flagellar basal-body rod protein FlgF
MDRMIYVAMTGARQAMQSQAGASHNVANAATVGFRAVQERLTAAPIAGQGLQTRVNSIGLPGGLSERPGTIQQTGRDLDIAIQGDGWLAVQDEAGREVYTRAGNLRINASGLLETGAGQLVLGSGGPITVPPYQSLFIGGEGQVSIIGAGQQAQALAEVGRLKLVTLDNGRLAARGDGLYELPDGETAPADASVRIASGQLESSNVNATEALVQMIELTRNYEMQVRAMNAAEQADTTAARLLRMNG